MHKLSFVILFNETFGPFKQLISLHLSPNRHKHWIQLHYTFLHFRSALYHLRNAESNLVDVSLLVKEPFLA